MYLAFHAAVISALILYFACEMDWEMQALLPTVLTTWTVLVCDYEAD